MKRDMERENIATSSRVNHPVSYRYRDGVGPATVMPLDEAAQALDDAARFATAMQRSAGINPISVSDAYAVQALSVRRRIDRGEKLIGIKVGKINPARTGGGAIMWGRLTDAMRFEDGEEIDLAGFIQPRVQPAIAFVLKRPLEGRVSLAEAMGAVEAVSPAAEMIDSRYRDPDASPSDIIADNAGGAGFVLGRWNPRDVDIRDLGMVMLFAGRPVQIASAAAVLGHPARGLAAASRLAAEAGFRLEAGSIVLAGPAAAAEPLRPGLHVRLEVEQLGSAGFSTVAGCA